MSDISRVLHAIEHGDPNAAGHREAVESLEKAYQERGARTLSRFFAAMNFHKLGDKQKARECYQEALKLPRIGSLPGLDFDRLTRAECDAVLNNSKDK
jgi:Tfp pilus assembly protein PilF